MPDQLDDDAQTARNQVAWLEINQARAVREFLLGDKTALDRLKDTDTKIAALRPKLSKGSTP